MIHHTPPRLTPAQAMHARQCLAIHASARIGAYLTPEDREWGRRFARRMLRETLGKDWRDGDDKLEHAATFGSALIRQAINEWDTLTTDCRDVYCFLLMNDRIARYLTLFGGSERRGLWAKLARAAERGVAMARSN